MRCILLVDEGDCVRRVLPGGRWKCCELGLGGRRKADEEGLADAREALGEQGLHGLAILGGEGHAGGRDKFGEGC